jgi:hypothetical protein
MSTKLPVRIVPVGNYFRAQLGDVPLWDAGTLDFALMCARSYFTGKTMMELTGGMDIMCLDPKTYKD